jgi:DNA recombination protein RmuC
MENNLIISGILFLASGLVMGYVIARLRYQKSDKSIVLEREVAVLQANIQSIQQQANSRENEWRRLREEDENRFRSQLQNKEDQYQQEQKRTVVLNGELEKFKAELSAKEDLLAEKKAEILQLHEKLTHEFEALAGKILEEKTQRFTEQNKTNLTTILDPLKEKIKEFEQKVEQHYTDEGKEKASLRQEIRLLHDLNKVMHSEAQNLTRALKGDTKTQGNWGEFILESILEKSGLVKDREYQLQTSLLDEEGKRFQPDVLITLPDNRHMIIDSKVSLVAYENFMNCEDELARESYLKEHLSSIRKHVKGLSEKNYQNLTGITSMDFVLLFVPIEPAFALAVSKDHHIFNDAFEKNIVIVSPTTLLATLRTVANIWRNEHQNQNALEISRLAGSMYDKLVGFADDMGKIKTAIRKADEHYEEAYKKLSEGRGNVLSTAQRIKTLGAKTTKQLPQSTDNDTETETDSE